MLHFGATFFPSVVVSTLFAKVTCSSCILASQTDGYSYSNYCENMRDGVVVYIYISSWKQATAWLSTRLLNWVVLETRRYYAYPIVLRVCATRVRADDLKTAASHVQILVLHVSYVCRHLVLVHHSGDDVPTTIIEKRHGSF